ncbi:Unknown protein sequence [Pseudomonas viridiflava]|uniref:Uncharacterized protein n=1 Tax=Pseudomonas syringae pv. ribicola TaxID=55398 RepID=A0A0Q0BBW9_PSESI|nr:Unknown protein sequence [Pseudomonas syringae pv. ribicola]KPZ21719.1 Unknown protein sequence [Pseudomonas viridiflava]
MLGHQFRNPIDEGPDFGADMPVRRKRYVHRHRVHTPVFEQRHQITTAKMRPDHVVGKPDDTHSCQPGSQIGIAVVHRQYVTTVDMHAFLTTMHGVRQRLAGACPQITDNPVMRVLEVLRMVRRSHALQIAGRRVNAQPQIPDPSCNQRLISDLSATQHTVHVLSNQIDDPVTGTQVDLDVGIARVKGRQCRHQQQAGEGAGDVHAESAPRQCRSTGQAGLGIVHVCQQLYHTLVIRSAIRRDVDLARGAIEQLDPQTGLKLLHQLRHAGLAHVQRAGGLGEAASLHHSRKRLHRIEPIHSRPVFMPDCLGLPNSDDYSCAFIRPAQAPKVDPS